MKFPWNRKYLEISFHIIVTLIAVYALKLCVDCVAYIITNLGEILGSLADKIGWVFSVFSTVVTAFIISYIFDPVVNFFQRKYDFSTRRYILPYLRKKGIIKTPTNSIGVSKQRVSRKYRPRTAGTALTYLLVFGIIIVSGWFFVNKVSKNGGGNIAESFILFVNNTVNEFSGMYDNLKDMFDKYGVLKYIDEYLKVFMNYMTTFVKDIGNGLVGFATSLGSGVINVVLSIVIAFYFLRDKARIKKRICEICDALLPSSINETLRDVLGDIHAVFSGYIRGQVLDASIMAILISVSLSIIGVDFAIVIGVVSGFSNIIPYFGACIAFVLAVTVTLFSGTPIKALYAAIIILILQQIDGIVIGPRVVGQNVKLSPVLVIIALAVAGEMFGLLGMILAVPIFATLKLFAERFFKRQQRKKGLKTE